MATFQFQGHLMPDTQYAETQPETNTNTELTELHDAGTSNDRVPVILLL